ALCRRGFSGSSLRRLSSTSIRRTRKRTPFKGRVVIGGLRRNQELEKEETIKKAADRRAPGYPGIRREYARRAGRRTPSGIRPDPAPGTQRQARLLRLEFVMTPAARRTRSPQQLLARKRRQVLQRAATKRAREFPVEPQIPPLTEPCARTDERMVAACHEQTRRRLDFKGGEIGIPIRPLDPSLLHQHRKIAENNLIKEYAIKFALAESG